MKILLITMYFAPDPAANSVIMTELVEHLLGLGHDVTVVTTFPHYDTNHIWPEYRGKLVQRDTYHGAQIVRTYIYVPQDKTSLFGRLLNYVSFNVLSTLGGLCCKHFDAILAPSPPLTIGLSAYIISRLRRVPFVYNVQDIYPDIAIRLGVLTNPRLIRFFQWLERFVYRKAAGVTVLSEGFRQNLLRKGVADEKVHIIPNFIDVDFVKPLPKANAFARAYGLDDKVVVMYAGNIGLSQGLDSVLEVARLLHNEPEIRFVIVGNGAAKKDLTARAVWMQLDNVLFLPFQPRESVPEMYASADISLVCLRDGIGNESVPSKAYTIMASARPLVAAVGAEAETRQLIADADCGVAVDSGNPAQLADAIRKLAQAPEHRCRLGENGRCYVERHHTPSTVADSYASLFSSLT
jgi:colanic acid biosynthesis glycosyl transferase WcaI